MNLQDAKTLRVAKAIYKRHENNSIVSKQLRPATKAYAFGTASRSSRSTRYQPPTRPRLRSSRDGGERLPGAGRQIYASSTWGAGARTQLTWSQGGLAASGSVCGYLPTLNEEEEWTCADFQVQTTPHCGGLVQSKTLEGHSQCAGHGHHGKRIQVGPGGNGEGG